MTKVILNGTIKGLRGKIGNLIFRQLPDGTTVVSRAQPKKNSRQKKRAKLKRSAKQQAHNSRFQEAAAYARWADDIHPVYAERAGATTMKTAYNFAVSDWWHAPEIHKIERREGRILVEVSDNISVTRVQVTVLNDAGDILARGEAARCEGDQWEFASEAEGAKVIAEAWDLPGNKAKSILSPA